MSDGTETDYADELQSAVEEAKANFDLVDKLRGRAMRQDSITVFTDEITGEAHQKVELEISNLSETRARLSLLEEAASELKLTKAALALGKLIQEEEDSPSFDKERFDELTAERDELAREMKRTSLTFNLRAVPPIIVKGSQRETRKKLGIVRKGITDDQEEQYAEHLSAAVFAAMTTSYVDHETGAVVSKLTQEYAHALSDLLPESEAKRIAAKIDDLALKNVIGTSVIQSADF